MTLKEKQIAIRATFKEQRKIAELVNDNGPCAPLALAIALDQSYIQAVQHLARYGRKHGQPTQDWMIEKILRDNGKKLVSLRFEKERLKNVRTYVTLQRHFKAYTNCIYFVYATAHIGVIRHRTILDSWSKTRKRIRTIKVMVDL